VKPEPAPWLYALVAVLVLLAGVWLGLPGWAVLAAIGIAWAATFYVRWKVFAIDETGQWHYVWHRKVK
jgi:hypothetical protein